MSVYSQICLSKEEWRAARRLILFISALACVLVIVVVFVSLNCYAPQQQEPISHEERQSWEFQNQSHQSTDPPKEFETFSQFVGNEHQSTKSSQQNANTISTHQPSHESPLFLVNTLAQHNNFTISYERKENRTINGPFVVVMHLGNETYEAEGKTVRKAKQLAGKLALEHTAYKQPPAKIKKTTTKVPTN